MSKIVVNPDTLKTLQDLDPNEKVQIKIRNCNVCSTISLEKMKQCSGCKSTYYCSAECQRKDWPKHKSVCKEIGGTVASSVQLQKYTNSLTSQSISYTGPIEGGLLIILNVSKFLELINNGHELIANSEVDDCGNKLPYLLSLFHSYEVFASVYKGAQKIIGHSDVFCKSLISAAKDNLKIYKRYVLIITSPEIGFTCVKEISQ